MTEDRLTWLNSFRSAVRYDAKDTVDFLDHLRPERVTFLPSGSSWIYRGHPDASWRLLPSLWRRLIAWEFDGLQSNCDGGTDYDSAEAIESFLVDDFVRRANDIGLRLPGRLGYGGPPEHRVHELVVPERGELDADQRALAQHYGVPTSLLDWSEVAEIAAYFATEPLDDNDVDDDRLCVWALNESVVGHRAPGEIELKVDRVMKGDNAYIAAQHGVFTRLEMNHDRIEPGSAGELIDLLEFMEVIFPPQPSLIQITVDRSEREAIRDELRDRRITRATIYPSLGSVAAEVLDSVIDC